MSCPRTRECRRDGITDVCFSLFLYGILDVRSCIAEEPLCINYAVLRICSKYFGCRYTCTVPAAIDALEAALSGCLVRQYEISCKMTGPCGMQALRQIDFGSHRYMKPHVLASGPDLLESLPGSREVEAVVETEEMKVQSSKHQSYLPYCTHTCQPVDKMYDDVDEAIGMERQRCLPSCMTV